MEGPVVESSYMVLGNQEWYYQPEENAWSSHEKQQPPLMESKDVNGKTN